MPRWLRYLTAGAAILVVAAAGGLVWKGRAEADKLVTNPIATRRLPTKTPLDFGLVYDDVSIAAADGARLVAWYVPTVNGAVVVAQHGYKSQRGEMLNEAEMLHRHGYGVLITAMRAHDMSDGTVISFGRTELADLGAWVEFARRQRSVDASRISILGNSLGGTLGIELAARMPEVRAVVANSAFSSLNDTIDTSVRFFTGLPPFPFAPIIRFWAQREAGFDASDVDATRWIGRISPRPVFLMQGGSDVVISTASGQRLYDAAREPKQLWFDQRVGHSGFDTAHPEEYEQRVVAFLDAALRPS
ncbi:MAG: alpha/beta hydrolase [Acidobacteriota bacterium]